MTLFQDNKWLYLLVYSFKQGNLKLRGFVLSQIGFLVELSITLFIWSLFTNQSKETITYFFMGFIIQRLAWNSFAGELSKDVVSGKLNGYLLRPINFYGYILVKEIGNRFIANIFSALTVLALFPFYNQFLTFPSNSNFWIFLPFLVIVGFLIDYCISLLLTAIAFFEHDFASYGRIVVSFLTLCSGIRIPFGYLPEPFKTILSLNPNAWMAYQPMQIYLGKYTFSESVFYLFLGFAWVAVLLVIIKFIYKIALKKYEGVGL